MPGVIGVIAGSKAEIEAQLDHIVNMMGLLVGGFCGFWHDGVDNTKVGCLVFSIRWFLNSIDFKIMGESSAHSIVGL